MNQGQLAAIVYLENNLTAQAFTPDRLEVLKLLSGQAAIALTNAKLYTEVKERENRLTQFINAMPIGVTVIDSSGQISYANPTASQLSGINYIPELNKVNPVANVEITSQQSTRRVIALAPNQPKYRILIADDAFESRQLLVKLLLPFGFEIYQATNGIEAIECWEKNSPHLIFMDLRMPVMDGYEATKQIKARETEDKLSSSSPLKKGGGGGIEFRSTAIIAVTASSFEEEKAGIMAIGCDDFLRKPFTEQHIFDTLHKHMGVQFVFKQLNAASNLKETDANILTKQAFCDLPWELVANLEQGISNLDLAMVQRAIAQIREINQPLAEAIALGVQKFQYEQLLDLITSLSMNHED